MNAERLLQHYEQIADAPDAIARLRRFILDLAVRGKLVPQDSRDELEAELLKRIGNFSKADTTLPENWCRAKVGSLLDFQYGKGLKAAERLQNGPVPVFGSNGIVGQTDEPLTIRPSVIVGRKGSAGALNLCDGPSWTTDVAYFIEVPHFFEIRYLFCSLQSLSLDKLGKGVKPGLSRSDAYEKTIDIPPLAEQHRIVAKVDELMALCDELEAARTERETKRDQLAAASLARVNFPDPETFRDDARFALDALPALTARPDQIKQLRQTILNLAVRGKLVPQDPADEPAVKLLKRISVERAERAKNGTIPKPKATNRDAARLSQGLPVGWSPIALGDVCNLVTSGSRGWGEYYADSGPGFIRAQNIRFGRTRLDDLAYVRPPSNSEGSRTQVYRNDLLIVITGAGVTNPALLEKDLGEAYVSQHVGLVRPSDAGLSPWLLLCLMADAGGRGELVECAYGAGKPGLNLDNIRSLSAPLPPLAEQHRIVAKVDELMALCDQLEASLTSVDEAREKLLDALLAEALAPAGSMLLQEAAE